MKTKIVKTSILLGAASILPAQSPSPSLFAWQFIEPLTRYDASALGKLVGLRPNESKREAPVHFGTMVDTFPFSAIDVDMDGNTTFRSKTENIHLFPFCDCPAPNGIQLTYARSVSDLLELFIPNDVPNAEAKREHFKNINNWISLEANLSSEEAFNATLGAMYVRNGRLIGIACTIFYPGNPEKLNRTVIEPFRELSVNCWVSPVYVHPPE